MPKPDNDKTKKKTMDQRFLNKILGKLTSSTHLKDHTT
jgi:hypothetical protein